MTERFSPRKHVPKYTRYLLNTLQTPLLVYFFIFGNLILIVQILLFHHYEVGINEHVQSLFDSAWWGLATITTVGYGDIVPMTPQGRLVGMFLMGTGVVFFVSFTALLVSIYMANMDENTNRLIRLEMEQIKAHLNEIEKSIKAMNSK